MWFVIERAHRRRGRTFLGGVAIGAMIVVVLACNAITGSGDLEVGAAAVSEEGGTVTGVDGGGGGVPDAPVIVPPPTCSCVVAPPSDWKGPYALLDNDRAPGTTCPTGLTVAYQGGTSPQGACAPCTCAAPIGACATEYQVFGTSNCNSPCFPRRGIDGACQAFNYCAPNGSSSVRVTVVGASCAASGGAKQPAVFESPAIACTFASSPPGGGGCPAGNVCTPASEGAPNARACIVHSGEVDCPQGPYQSKSVVFDSTNDAHTCSACTCDVPCSTATVQTNTDGICGTQIDTTPSTQSCDPFGTDGIDAGSARVTTAPTRRASCSPSGGQPSGNVAGVGPTTLCCLN
jgi:hypothetical protein